DGIRDFHVTGVQTCALPISPVLMLTPAGVGVLVQGFSVEAAEGEGVFREVSWNPVQDDADSGLMQPIDEVAQVVGIAEAAGRCRSEEPSCRGRVWRRGGGGG